MYLKDEINSYISTLLITLNYLISEDKTIIKQYLKLYQNGMNQCNKCEIMYRYLTGNI